MHPLHPDPSHFKSNLEVALVQQGEKGFPAPPCESCHGLHGKIQFTLEWGLKKRQAE